MLTSCCALVRKRIFRGSSSIKILIATRQGRERRRQAHPACETGASRALKLVGVCLVAKSGLAEGGEGGFSVKGKHAEERVEN